MGELIDFDLLLGTSVRERERAELSQAQEKRQAAARRARERRMAGNTRARKSLEGAWSPVLSRDIKAAMEPTVFQGEGPPEGAPPTGYVGLVYYRDTLTNDFYRWEAT